MNDTGRPPRILGAAFLFQFATSFSGMALILPLATGSVGPGVPGDIGQTLANLVRNAGWVQLDIFLELVTAAGVVYLGSLLYSLLRKQSEALALTAFGLYLVEAALLLVTKLVLFALLVLARQAHSPGGPGEWEPLARLVYETMSYANTMLNFAFCLGGALFYALMFRARTVPGPLAVWGLVGVLGVLAGVAAALFGIQAPAFLYAPYVPFELVIGVWILVSPAGRPSPPRRSAPGWHPRPGSS